MKVMFKPIKTLMEELSDFIDRLIKSEIKRDYIKIKRPFGYIDDSCIFKDGKISELIPVLYTVLNISGYTVINIDKKNRFSIVANDYTRAILIYGKAIEIIKWKHKVNIIATAPIQLMNGVKCFTKISYELTNKLEPTLITVWPLVIDKYNFRNIVFKKGQDIKIWKIQEFVDELQGNEV